MHKPVVVVVDDTVVVVTVAICVVLVALVVVEVVKETDVVEVKVVDVLVVIVVVVGLLQSMEAKSALTTPELFASHAAVARAGKQVPFNLL